MSYEFQLPDVGEGITESELLQWHVKEGDLVKEDDLLCEIETDKAVVEIPVPCNGTVTQLHAQSGTTITVGSVLASFDTAAGSNTTTAEVSPPIQAPAQPVAVADEPAPSALTNSSVRAAPSTRKYARELDVDLSSVTGSGPKGRILRSDIERSQGNNTQSGVRLNVTPVAIQTTQGEKRTPIKGLRKAIAETMVRSVTIVPHATSAFSCSAERFMALRKLLQQQLDCRISFTAMVMKTMIPAIKRYPFFNASIDDTANEIVEHGQINIGFATHTEAGLMVPVIKNADQKTLAQISTEIEHLAALARSRKIDLADLKGGTMTLSNVGSHGKHDRVGRPIVNHPEVAIIAMTRIKPMPAVVDGQVVAQQTLDMVTSYDHRLIDGVYGAMFMEHMIEIIEEPGLLLAE
ncbi:MAG: 2-oxo acid dehydrogenase subunit E2 [Immundisolibacteraceae bacterium]|nr:2-oxo acid dehydrogenase subunit E2 [Immundisolibacteraceae bacterium]